MTVTVQSFRVDLPEFADPNLYPPSSISYWLNVAGQLLNKARWGDPAVQGKPNTLYDFGQEMYAAHNLALEARAMAEAANGVPPGQNTGPVTSKSVDKVSVGYGSDASEEGAGNLNLTIYGTRFFHLQQMVGVGGIQVGIGYDPFCGLNGPAWPGPWPWNFPNMNE